MRPYESVQYVKSLLRPIGEEIQYPSQTFPTFISDKATSILIRINHLGKVTIIYPVAEKLMVMSLNPGGNQKRTY
ncbi:hypothetical protein AO072_16560 [Pseudomonas syringae ICMP 13102]|nr:hypothetical protein PsyrB_19715 [Pseudomonas syringae pv. syringae B301D]EXL28606.1 hypothetical protein PssB301D_05197 [Pseudomonas syringae pv. syringae str. B301D-R]KTB84262.1 hypothetical protein AO072_16560 [Pseudomonas syringae ICMP 13102]